MQCFLSHEGHPWATGRGGTHFPRKCLPCWRILFIRKHSCREVDGKLPEDSEGWLSNGACPGSRFAARMVMQMRMGSHAWAHMSNLCRSSVISS